MKCPTCTTVDLVMSERQGIEIDYCPTCRGVWLDRGELDKVIERSAAYAAQPLAAPAPQAAPVQAQPAPNFGHHGKRHHHDDDDHHGYGKHGKRSFLKDLFD